MIHKWSLVLSEETLPAGDERPFAAEGWRFCLVREGALYWLGAAQAVELEAGELLVAAPATRGSLRVAPNDNWADGWTTLSKSGYLKSSVTLPAPPAPDMASGYDAGSGTLSVSTATQYGYSYQLQGTGSLTPPVAWTNIGIAQWGTGGTLTFPVAIGNATNGFFRMVAQ